MINSKQFPSTPEEFRDIILACYPPGGPALLRNDRATFCALVGRAYVQQKALASLAEKEFFCAELAKLILPLLPDPDASMASAFHAANAILRRANCFPNPSANSHQNEFYQISAQNSPALLAEFFNRCWQ